MLQPGWLALFCLGVLWLNAGLVLLVATRQLLHLWKLRRWYRAARRRGEVLSGVLEGPAGILARRTLHQTGRSVTERGPERILFSDGPQSFSLSECMLRVDGRERRLPARDVGVEVWVDTTRMKECARDRGETSFEEAWTAASTFKGFSREAHLAVRSRDPVWVVGRAERREIVALDDHPLLVSMVEPVAWVTKRIWLVIGFLSLASATLIGITALALVPPLFGMWSTLGAALGVTYFLAVPPLATSLRDALKTPGYSAVEGCWTSDSADAPLRGSARAGA